MSALRLFLFGAPRVEREAAVVGLRRSRGLALLAYLAATRQPHTREALTALLWPNFDPEGARNNLRRELSLLKAALGEGVLVAERDLIALDPGAIESGRLWVDEATFETGIEAVRTHVHENTERCPTCTRALEEIVALYNDDFLVGFSLPDSPPFDEWQRFQSERLRRALAEALQTLIAWYTHQGAYERAIGHAQRWLALDPLHEPAHQALMRLHSWSGQTAAAIRQYEQLLSLLKKELGIGPQPDTEALFATIKAHRLALPEPTSATVLPPEHTTTPEPPHNLPADTTPFIGRTPELTRLDSLLSSVDVRLITILGVGGIGKTRLALAAARRAVSEAAVGVMFPDGVFFVPLASLAEPGDIPAALALNLGVAPGRDGASSRLLLQSLNRRHTLLILDNLEHLITPESTAFIQDILVHAPGVKILTTSRVRLGLSGEYVLALEGLDVPTTSLLGEEGTPDGLGEAGAGSAVALFAEAARRVQPSFLLDQTNLTPIVRICRLVQGMPLGIELAAVWLELLAPEAILAEIERSLDFLESTHADAPARQASLRAVFVGSWRLLTPAEQEALTRLTIFPGSFTRAAAEAVAGATLRTLLSLTNKSWLQPVGPERYRIHELLRQYAAQALETNPEAGRALQEQHATYFASYLATLDQQMKGRRPDIAFDALTTDIDNVRSALAWLISADRFEVLVGQMLPPLFRYLESRYHYFLFAPLILEAQRRAEALSLERERSILLMVQGAFIFNQGFPTRFIDYHWVEPAFLDLMREAWEPLPDDAAQIDLWSVLLAWQYGRFVDVKTGVERLRQLQVCCAAAGRRWEEALAWQSLGRLLSRRPSNTAQFGRPGEAWACLQQAQTIFDALGDERESAVTLLFRGFERQSEEELVEARRTLLEARTRLRALGEHIVAATINWQLAEIHMQLGEMDVSLRYFHEMADTLLNSGYAHLAIASISRESYEAVRYGDLDYAQRLRRQSLALSRAVGDVFNEAFDCWEMGELYRVMGRLAEARHWFERARSLFGRIGSVAGHSFYYRGLGDVALAEGDPAQAEAHFAASAAWAERTQHPWQHTYALVGLGRAALAAGQLDTARTRFVEALRMSEKAGDPGVTLVVIAGVAHLCQATGDAARAAELARLVLAHPLSWRETRDGAAALLEMEPEEAAALRQQRPFDLGELVEELSQWWTVRSIQ
jgi:predicted ATPase/DNA-binding SARP family transcriptional activator